MSDIIQRLPEILANQIAAGEVVQRPSSVIKELLENSIDAGATRVRVSVKDGGRTLITVEDDGGGMSFNDAVMCFERHATSKIHCVEDLFQIHTKGFRGEALASVAAIAQVELKSKRPEDPMGVHVVMEGGVMQTHAETLMREGTVIHVKNLFFNTPGRRYFLKSDAVEMKHIMEEFSRVAMLHPEVEFSIDDQGEIVSHLPITTFRHRIVKMLGQRFEQVLVPLEEATHWLKIQGFLTRPEASKKQRGDQYLFLNGRFIKNNYLHHAIQSAYQGMIPDGTHPAYFIQLTMDPALVDVNIHPTKTEVKFQDERSVYAILHAAARRSLGMHNITPTLDFNQETLPITTLSPSEQIKVPGIELKPGFNPFEPRPTKRDVVQEWLALQADLHAATPTQKATQTAIDHPEWSVENEVTPIQVMRKYIVFEYNRELWLVDQVRAHRQVVFESNREQCSEVQSQLLTLPYVWQCGMHERQVLRGAEQEFRALGFAWQDEEDGVRLTAVPMMGESAEAFEWWKEMVLSWENGWERVETPRDRMAWKQAQRESVQGGQFLTVPEMKEIVAQLLACENPFYTPQHDKIIFKFNETNLFQFFQS